MLSGRTTTTVQAPAAAPVDLHGAGKPDWRELAGLLTIMLATLLPAIGGGALLIFSWPHGENIGGWQALGIGAGGVLLFGGLSVFWTLRREVMRGIHDYYERVRLWNDATLDKYIEGDGLVTAQQVSEWSYSPQDMRHVALAFLWLLMSNQKSLSIEKLTKGGLLLNAGHRAFKLMDMTQDGAAQFLDLCARAGVISGRGPRAAGTITIMDPKTALLKVLNEAAKDPTMIAAPLENEP